MSKTDETRWQQRLESFGKALARLKAACVQDSYSDLELAGLVQMFEFSFELCWNSLKDLLFYEGYDARSPRSVLRTAFKAGYLSETETETLLDALEKRNLLSHTYNEKRAQEAEALIKQRYCLVLVTVHASLEARRGA
jgi:nucleotidyltransferase substrate binding protein (TIGR01987 family)